MATSIIKLHTLSGVGEGGPPCYLLQVDEFHCLLDCGWCPVANPDYVKKLSQWARHIDAVLLSHQGLRHLGLLPYLVGSCGLKCPVYATTPVYKMGQLTLYDFYQSMWASEDFSAFTLDDVDAAFDLVTQVKYHQTVNLPGRGRGLCITPLPSGHTLGGTIWKLVKEDTDIVYAVDFNHKKERHLNGATFDACMRPRLLILDASNALYSHPRRKDRDENLRQCILKSLRRGGNILIAVDTAGRCLEIAHFLEQCWMNQVVLASFSDLSCGFARQLFAEWADNDLNTVILTSRDSCAVTSGSESENYPLHKRLIGLAKGDPDARTGLPTSSTGTLVLPLTLSQRVSAAQLERLENEMPRMRNAVHMGLASFQSAATSRAMDVTIPVGFDAVDDTLNGRRPSPTADAPPSDTRTTTTTSFVPANQAFGSNGSLAAVADTPYANSEDALANVTSNVNTVAATPPFTLTTSTDTQVEHHENSVTRGSVGSKLLLSRENHPHTQLVTTDSASEGLHTSSALGTQLTAGRHQPGYDIYPGLHNHAGGQFFRMAKRTQLLFPPIERKVHWDEYGGHLDRDLFVGTEKQANHSFRDSKHKGHKSSQISVGDVSINVGLIAPSVLECLALKTCDDPAVKTHVVTHQLEIPLRCELVHLDYEGRSDGEAMKRIVVGLRPQEVILVGNSRTVIEHLAEYCRTVMLLGQHLTHAPNVNEVVNCTKEGDIYQARMKDSLVSSLKFTKIREYELAWVEATISLEDQPSVTSARSSSESEDVEMHNDVGTKGKHAGGPAESRDRTYSAGDQLPMVTLPSGPVGTHKTVFVNEPKLSDLKQLLLSQGLMAEFVSGVLVVDNCVAIKRSEAAYGSFDLHADCLTDRFVLFKLSVMKLTLDKAIEDVQLLISRLKTRESTADSMREKIADVKSQLLGMRQYQEEVLTFDSLSSRLADHRRGPLILCLAAENKQMEQLRIENQTLCNSLDEHQTALDLIMNKYRGQVSKLMQTNRLETLMNHTSSASTYPRSCRVVSGPLLNNDLVTAQLASSSDTGQTGNEPLSHTAADSLHTDQISILAAMAQDVCDRGDAYATELEAELHRLRAENAGLREMLMISSSYAIDQPDNLPTVSTSNPDSTASSLDNMNRSTANHSLSGTSDRFESAGPASSPLRRQRDMSEFFTHNQTILSKYSGGVREQCTDDSRRTRSVEEEEDAEDTMTVAGADCEEIQLHASSVLD
ncbi:cleavage and polyadenylation specificity factor subunit 2 [Paragonimus westermani]|uniref:Cleavage and polyadenylation specificity factor subunit 2 n=1 Tax=Paragonimus westermani TaxID=34504 RepID=A0A5J4P165_9TREM|nr:cleavage and polyadenylation specificity factor subunit 2 [Paragonimus westermani]